MVKIKYFDGSQRTLKGDECAPYGMLAYVKSIVVTGSHKKTIHSIFPNLEQRTHVYFGKEAFDVATLFHD